MDPARGEIDGRCWALLSLLRAAMTKTCVQLKWNWMAGVCPLGAHVRTRVGRSPRPD